MISCVFTGFERRAFAFAAFRSVPFVVAQGRFNESLGVVTVMFVGIVICAWRCRRRLVPVMRPESEGRTVSYTCVPPLGA